MVKRMLIDATHPEETRVVVVNGTKLEEFDVEAASKRQLKGNIYLAKVTRVEPSLQAAFVDYGGNRHGFLAFSEIHPDYYQIPVADREALMAEVKTASREDADANGDDSAEDTVDVVGGDDTDEIEIESEKRRTRNIRSYKIQEVIKRRQILLVQVVKEERGNKGAALTTYLSLAGRYGVLMPNTSRGGGISRKITNVADRKRLKTIISDLKMPEGMAVIIRTAGAERTKAEIRRDCEYLVRTWDEVRELTLGSTAPSLVYEEGSLIKRSLRDIYSKDIEEVIVDGDEGYKNAKDFMKTLMPSHAKKVKRYGKEENLPLLQRYQIESQLDSMHQPTVQLRSGGYIVINPTEALVSIDVNSGRSTRERNIEETAYRTNIEAAEEIARQLRLRDLSGLIVIDFIDMEENRNQHAVERKLKDAMRNDRARIQIGRISVFGLLELSRQRLRPSFLENSSAVCPHCGGSGHVRTIDSSALQMLRILEEEGMKRKTSELSIWMPTPVALFILNQKRAALTDIETRFNLSISVLGDDSLIAPDHRIERVRGGDNQNAPEEEARSPEASSDDDSDSSRPPRRRRRRRGGRQSQDNDNASDNEEATSTESDDAGSDGDDAENNSNDNNDETDSEGRPRKRRRRGKRGGRKRGRRDGSEGDTNEDGSETNGDAAGNDGSTPDDATDADDNAGKAAADDQKAEPEQDAGADKSGEAEAEASEPVKKPRRRSRSRKKPADADADAEVTTKEAETADGEETPAAESEEKPKRKRAPRRRKPAAAKQEQATEEAAPAAETASEPVAEETASAPEAQKVEPETTDEPAEADPSAEVITVGEDTAEEDRPRRRGWWNRVMGK
ncbi:MAG: ribonuclease E/G [Rhodospirillales bacterium]